MQIHQIKRNHPNPKPSPRVGRGGKRGSYSGKGVKGQKARAGHRIRPAIRDLIQRLPKLRGVKHRPVTEKLPVLNVSDLEKIAKNGVISEKTLGRRVKILGDGEIKGKVTVEGLPVSKSAKNKIEKMGGQVK